MSTTQRRDPRAAEVAVQEIAVNVFRTESALVLVAPMPAVRPDDVEVTVDGSTVTLRAELRTDAPKDYLIHEWDYGAYERTVDLPDGYGQPVTASLGNGQLAVSLTAGGEQPGGPIVVRPAGTGPG